MLLWPSVRVVDSTCLKGPKSSWKSDLQAKEAEALAAAKSREQKLEEIVAEEREGLLAEAGHLKQYLPNNVLINKPKLPPLQPCLS